MNLTEWQSTWDALGRDDPLWVVLTDPSRKGGRWDPKEFFAVGEHEINTVLADLKTKNLPVARQTALDFGCGVGRLSQALAPHFDQVHGVDISPSMIDHANRFNQFPEKVTYHINSSIRLEAFENNSMDFIYSNIALQHVEPRFSKEYLKEFMRVLRPRGIAVFQMISATLARKLFPESFVAAYRRVKHGHKPYFGMFGIPEKKIIRVLEQAGGEVIAVEHTPFTWRWVSMRFFVRKN
jgi:ubiquinone/menaquinone biosynthesis C-methylase UbiE